MRLSSPELSDSSTPLATHRSKNRRRILPSQSTTTEDDPHPIQYDDDYSPPSSPQEEGLADDDETAIADSQLGSNSVSRSSDPFQDSSTSAVAAPSPPAYINVAPLPIFRGAPGECPIAHLSRFDRVCRANNASTAEMVVRIFPVTLDGEAGLWYDLTVEPHPSMPWAEIKSAFLRAYQRPDSADRSRAELVAIRQGDDEGVTAYHLRMQWILRKWPDHGLPDALLRGIFVDGLREDFQDWVVPQQPGSLEEAVRLALSWEQARSVRAARRRNDAAGGDAKCGFCDGAHEENTCEVRRRMRELWRRNKEEMVALPSGDGGGGVVAAGDGDEQGITAAAAAAGSVVRREGEEGVGRALSLRRRSQCQCWKHQCWKKLERSNSAIP